MRKDATQLPGKEFWRSLDEAARTPEFEAYVHREFPHAASEWTDDVSRRNFLKLMGASLALAGVGTGCYQQPEEKIIPYVDPPERLVPGKPIFYATAMPWAGYGRGVLVEQHMGRPTKVEGNPDHPASLGAADAVTQASVLSLWDPDRAQVVSVSGNVTTWGTFIDAMGVRRERLRQTQGAGLRILTETVTSPTLAGQLRKLLEQFPQAKWVTHDPVGQTNAREGTRLAFGQPVNVVYDFSKAERVLSLESNFLLDEPGSVRYARQFTDGRRVTSTQDRDARQATMNRLYVVESSPTITGAMADHRVRVRASRVEALVRAIFTKLTRNTLDAGTPHAEFINALAADLGKHRGRCVIVPGPQAPAAVHVLAHAMNRALGNVGKTVLYTDPVEANPLDDDPGAHPLRQLAADMNSGACEALVILGGNPVYTAPSDVGFEAALRAFSNARTPDGRDYRNFTAHLNLYADETSYLCQWHLPESHYLEAWSDVRAFDGAATIIQPLIAPLYQSRSAHELLASMLGQREARGREIVRQHWRDNRPAGVNAWTDFEGFWTSALEKGVVAGTTLPPRNVSLQQDAIRQAESGTPTTQPTNSSGAVEVIYRLDPHVWDGRFANNGWLQELPKPLTKLTWDNAALLSPATALRLKLAGEDNLNEANGKLVVLKSDETHEVQVPIWILPGHPDDCMTLFLGYGREKAGRVGNRTATSGGVNINALRTTDNPWFQTGVTITPVGRRYPLACTQGHFLMEGRDLIRLDTIDRFRQATDGADEHGHPAPALAPTTTTAPAPVAHADRGLSPSSHVEEKHKSTISLTLYPDPIDPRWDYTAEGRHRWAMVIDNNSCIGCNACVVACQSENNIPIVGKDQVVRGREMHWLRIDTYFAGASTDASLIDQVTNPDGPYFEPVPCMHCEKAPCEVVCPVAATTHSSEGLNEMTYNRCVGTRYCQNNCPYKVRRFNFFHYAKDEARQPQLKLRANPDVTIRERGVMEKCTYCVQRLNETRVELKKLSVEASEAATPDLRERLTKKMDVVMRGLETACQQSCPTEAIVFGDWNYKLEGKTPTQVAQLKDEPHHYGLLEELGTQPRTTYLGRFTNPNPELRKTNEAH
ncbi:MAG: TAT-variant-translocated molybdopterin oxidoreductase [Tepidisphaeraceae bacterium]